MKIECLILLSLFLFSFNLENETGKYEYRDGYLKESIELLENHTFIYNRRQHFLNFTIKGNYNIVGDSLVLDSNPQKEKIIVRENFVKIFETKFFNITDKNGENITFHLYVTLIDGSIEVFRDQFEKLKFKSKPIKSFHILTTMGLKSPEYELHGKNTNSFDIQLETTRVFESEKWFFDKVNKKITPKGLDIKIQNYSLKKI
jgi:hypothetical protein